MRNKVLKQHFIKMSSGPIIFAPKDCVEFIIKRCENILKKDGETEEYIYWRGWLGETLGNIGDNDFDRLYKRVEKMEEQTDKMNL